MPELPEVEVTRRALALLVEGRAVRRALVREARLRWPVPRALARHLAGQVVERLERRGKYLLWRFAEGTLISHLGMSGAWRVYRQAPRPGPHDHVDLVFDACTLRLTDPRRFGALLWHPRARGEVARHRLLAGLGCEPFDPRFDGRLLHARTRGRRVSVKEVLLAGKIVVGVGNIYASESLFRAGIDPRAAAGSLGPRRCERLAQAVRAVLSEAISAGGSTLRDFVGAEGSAGEFTLAAAVYGRAGSPCRACGAPIRRLVQSARATYFCPRCQRR